MSQASIERPGFIVGLGNPGREYARTRHNVGFDVLEVLVSRWELGSGRWAFSGQLFSGRVARGSLERQVYLLAPQTYMNRSGQAVAEMTGFYKAQPSELLVVMDDLALPTGRVRARASGSAGGHNGLSDVMQSLGSQDVPRLRIGIGSPPGAMDARDYVLGRFSEQELETIRPAVMTAADAVEDWLFRGIDYVMERYNRKAET